MWRLNRQYNLFDKKVWPESFLVRKKFKILEIFLEFWTRKRIFFLKVLSKRYFMIHILNFLN